MKRLRGRGTRWPPAVPGADVLSPLVPDLFLLQPGRDGGGSGGVAPAQERCRGRTAASLSRCKVSVKCIRLQMRVAVAVLVSAWGERSHKQLRDPQCSCPRPAGGRGWKSWMRLGKGRSCGATLAGVSAPHLRAKRLTAAFCIICFEQNTVILDRL